MSRPIASALALVLGAVLALAATGRSVLQITQYFDRAPLAYVLSAVAAGAVALGAAGLLLTTPVRALVVAVVAGAGVAVVVGVMRALAARRLGGVGGDDNGEGGAGGTGSNEAISQRW